MKRNSPKHRGSLSQSLGGNLLLSEVSIISLLEAIEVSMGRQKKNDVSLYDLIFVL